MANKDTCMTCLHWSPGHPLGFCGNPKFIDVSGEDASKSPSDSLIYYDHEGYGSTVQVGPDFGCIHHKNKKAEAR